MYVGSAIADGGGQFLLVTTALPAPNLTATASDVWCGGTSEFSAVFVLPLQFIYLPLVTNGA